MLPKLDIKTEQYLAFLYARRNVSPDEIQQIYIDAERVIVEYIEPMWLHQAIQPPAIGQAAVLYVHQTLASNQKDSFAARYCMHALLAPFTKAVADKIG